MVSLAAFLVLVAVGMLIAGLAQGSASLQWGSFAASAVAAVVLGVSGLRRRRQARDDAATASPIRGPAPVRDRHTGATGQAGDEVVRRVVPPPVPPSSPSIPRVNGPVSGATAVSGLGELARNDPRRPGDPRDRPAVARQKEQRTGVLRAEDLLADGLPDDTVGAHPVATAGAHAGGHSATPVAGEPPVEVVEVTDPLLVLDLVDEVLVVDEHPRYHLAGCPHLPGNVTIPLPMVEARTDGFTPCGTCAPDRALAQRERARRSR